MSNRWFSSLTAAAVVAGVIGMLGSRLGAEPAAGVSRWEYRSMLAASREVTDPMKEHFASQGIHVIAATAFMSGLRDAGADGWELCDLQQWKEYGFLYYFKRPVK